MRQYMPGDTGYVSKGPSKQTTIDSYPRVPSEPENVKKVIRQGKDNPRALDLEEARRAAANRAEYTETRRELESWFEAQFMTRTKVYKKTAYGAADTSLMRQTRGPEFGGEEW